MFPILHGVLSFCFIRQLMIDEPIWAHKIFMFYFSEFEDWNWVKSQRALPQTNELTKSRASEIRLAVALMTIPEGKYTKIFLLNCAVEKLRSLWVNFLQDADPLDFYLHFFDAFYSVLQRCWYSSLKMEIKKKPLIYFSCLVGGGNLIRGIP